MGVARICFLAFCLMLAAGVSTASAQNAPTATSCPQAQATLGTGTSLITIAVSGGGTICPCLPVEQLWIERMVNCFAAPGGLIQKSVETVINNPAFYTFYRSILASTIIIAVAFFGLNLVMGSTRAPIRDGFVLLLKVGGVMLFFDNYSNMLMYVLDASHWLVTMINDAARGFGDICNGKGSGSAWSNWDCLFEKILGISKNALFLGIGGFATSFFFSSGIGTTVFFGVVYMIILVLMMAMRVVYNYLVAFFAVSFLFLLAPLFIPMVFFSRTYQKFTTYFKLILSYALQPPLIMLFVVMMLVALEFTIFVGPTSLYGTLSNTNPPKAMSFHEVMFTNAGGGGLVGGIVQAVSGQTEDFTRFIKESKEAVGGNLETNPGNLTTEAVYNDAVRLATQAQGIFENALDASGVVDDEGTIPFSLDSVGIDIDGLVSAISGRAGSTGSITKEQWFQDIALQLAASGIMVFILFQMILTVPQMAQDLVSQQFGRLGGVTQTQMVGESEIRHSIGMAKDAAQRGRQNQDPEGAVRSVAQEGYDVLAGGRN